MLIPITRKVTCTVRDRATMQSCSLMVRRQDCRVQYLSCSLRRRENYCAFCVKSSRSMEYIKKNLRIQVPKRVYKSGFQPDTTVSEASRWENKGQDKEQVSSAKQQSQRNTCLLPSSYHCRKPSVSSNKHCQVPCFCKKE